MSRYAVDYSIGESPKGLSRVVEYLDGAQIALKERLATFHEVFVDDVHIHQVIVLDEPRGGLVGRWGSMFRN